MSNKSKITNQIQMANTINSIMQKIRLSPEQLQVVKDFGLRIIEERGFVQRGWLVKLAEVTAPYATQNIDTLIFQLKNAFDLALDYDYQKFGKIIDIVKEHPEWDYDEIDNWIEQAKKWDLIKRGLLGIGAGGTIIAGFAIGGQISNRNNSHYNQTQQVNIKEAGKNHRHDNSTILNMVKKGVSPEVAAKVVYGNRRGKRRY